MSLLLIIKGKSFSNRGEVTFAGSYKFVRHNVGMCYILVSSHIFVTKYVLMFEETSVNIFENRPPH